MRYYIPIREKSVDTVDTKARKSVPSPALPLWAWLGLLTLLMLFVLAFLSHAH